MKTYKKRILAGAIALGVIVLNLTISVQPHKGSNFLSLSNLKVASSGAQAECSYVQYYNNGYCAPAPLGGQCVPSEGGYTCVL
jgi:hypothetical protein